MNRAWFCVLALALSAARLPADDGSWVNERGYVPAEGALYSEDGNPDIVLEKEYLELRDISQGATRAVFLFRNASNAAVTVECGFPVQVDFTVRPVTLDGNGGLAQAPGNPGAIEAWDFGDVISSRYAAGQPSPPVDNGFVKSVLAALDVQTSPWDAAGAMKAADADPDQYYAGTFFRDDQYPKGRREQDAAKLRALFGFRIAKDGKELAVPTCVVEFGEEPGHLVLHFRHQLSFAAGAAGTVTVTYAMPTWSAILGEPGSHRPEGADSSSHAPGVTRENTWKYVLQTASSWKGTLGRIVLAVPPGFREELPDPWQYLGAVKGQLLYTAENWKPAPDDDLSLKWTSTIADYPAFWRQETEPLEPDQIPAVDSPAKVLGASSSLQEKSDVFLPFGIWRNAPFDAARLFDGLPETAWAVRTARGGVGEHVRFSLDSAVCRLEVSNGYQRSTVDFPDKDTWSYYGKNNRVKTLDIVRDDGVLVQRLQLADKREKQMFNISLAAGVYRAVISGIYPGSRWNDTCLGELTFVRGTAVGFDALNTDTFFSALLKGESR